MCVYTPLDKGGREASGERRGKKWQKAELGENIREIKENIECKLEGEAR